MVEGSKPKAIDLFAGPGGLSLGLSLTGFNVVGAVEWDPQAGRTYTHNIGDHVHIGDIKELPPKEMERMLKRGGKIRSKKEIHLISGGPPCPGFSLIGRSKIANLIKSGNWEGSDHRHSFIDDPRNQLFREFVHYVDHFKPKYFIMENVLGMTSFKDKNEKPIISVIREEFEKLGYSVEARSLLASDYGVPQARKRVIFLGTKGKKQRIKYPTKININISARDAIKDLPKIDPLTGICTSNRLKPLRWKGHPGAFLQWVRKTPNLSSHTQQNATCSIHKTRAVNPRDQAIFPLIKSGENGDRVLYRDVYPDKLKDVKERLPRGYNLTNKDGKYWVEGPKWGGRNDNRWGWYDPSKFGDKMRRIRGDQPSPTIVAHLAKDGYMFIHPDQDRTISPREAARFQSFPDSFDFSAGGQNPLSSQFRQIGNAVPPILAIAIGSEVLKAMNIEPKMTLDDIF